MYSRFQISPQALNKKIFYWAGHFLSLLFLPFLQLFLSECACVLRIIMCFRFQVQLQLLNLFSRTLHYTSEFLAFVTRGRRPCQCLSEDTPAYQEVKGYSLETLPVLREMLRLKICVCWCVFHRESRSKGRERPVIIMFNADNISSGIFWGPLSLCLFVLKGKVVFFFPSTPTRCKGPFVHLFHNLVPISCIFKVLLPNSGFGIWGAPQNCCAKSWNC